MKKILIVCSSADTLLLKDQQKISTGYYLDELAVVAQYFIKAGYLIVIATPNGKKPIMDDRSNNVSFFGGDETEYKAAVKFVVSHPSMQGPHTLKEVAAHTKDYVALYVPGGHAPMTDLMDDPDLGKILRDFHLKNKITAFLCHGTAAAISALSSAREYRKELAEGKVTTASPFSKDWPYAGYRMTVFSNEEESVAESEMPAKLPFYAADALAGAGGLVENALPWQPFVIKDRELITGQNPASDRELAVAVVKALEERRTNNLNSASL